MSVPPKNALAKAIIATIGEVVSEKLSTEQLSYTMAELEGVAYALIMNTTTDEVSAIRALLTFGEHIMQRIMLSEERT